MRISQKKILKDLFESKPNQWIPLPEILSLNIAQYNARIKELREKGMNIENKWKIIEGKRHSWFKFVFFKSDKQGQLSIM